MKIYAVIDTNVWVSALVSKNPMSPTVRLAGKVFDGQVVPLYSTQIIEEYRDVLNRRKFGLQHEKTEKVLRSIISNGVEVTPQRTEDVFADADDAVFYWVAMAKREEGAYLVTGNMKHFPIKDFIVTPHEMMNLLDEKSI